MNKDVMKNLDSFINKFNISNPVICDADCQNDNNKKKLYTNYVNAKNNMLRGKENLEKAEKDYYTGTGKSQYYSNLQERRATKSIKNYMNSIEKNFNKNINNIKNYIKYADSQNIMIENISDLKDMYKNKKKSLVKQAKKTTWKKNIDDRLSLFYNNKNQTLSYWSNGILFYIYLILLLLILITIFLKKQYKNIKMYPFIICLIVLPFLIHPVYLKILTTLEHFKLDNIYFMFILFAIFLFVTIYVSYKINKKYSVVS